MTPTHFSPSQWIEGDFYSAGADLLSDGWAVFDEALQPVYFSASLQQLLGYRDVVLRRLWRRWRRLKSAPPALANLQAELSHAQQLFQQDGALHGRALGEIALPQGAVSLCLVLNALSLHDRQGRFGAILCLVSNVSAAKVAARDADIANQIFRHSLSAMYLTDPAGRIERVNPAFCRMTGYTAEEVVGRPPSLLAAACCSPAARETIMRNLAIRGYWEGEVTHRHKAGHVFPAAVSVIELRSNEGQPVRRLTSFSDITERKNSDSKIQQLAYFDSLTQLPNRTLLLDRLDQAIARAKRYGHRLALLFVDLDHFKQVNDQFGHAVGDQLLCHVARQLKRCVREEDTVARLSGDEFVVLLHGLTSKSDAVLIASRMAEKISGIFAQAVDVGGETVQCSGSVGIALFPDDGADGQLLLRHADQAMYYIKHHGKRNYKFFTPALDSRAAGQISMAADLARAVAQREFVLHYQPIMDSQGGAIVAVEALLRWQHPNRGLLVPGEFMAALEQGENLKAVTAWGLDQACRQMQAWRRQNSVLKRISVNVSDLQFYRLPLVQMVRDALAAYDLPPQCLELEVREATLMGNIDSSLETLLALRRLGVMVALDNFGQGASSMSVLKRLPMNRLKVDRGFVGGLPARQDRQMVEALVGFGHSLALEVVGEGVETPAQLAFLQEQGCEEVQGYLLSRPQPHSQLNLHP